MTMPLAALTDDELLALLVGDGPSEAPPPEDRGGRSAGGEAPEPAREAAAREALRRMSAVRRVAGPPSLRCSAEAYRAFGERLARRTQERFWVVALDARNRPVSRHLVALGALASCIVHPREVFAPLVRRRAAAAILVHNHPSGDVEPSPEDERLTERLVECGRILGIPVLDHLIVSRNGYYSFRDRGGIDSRQSTVGSREKSTVDSRKSREVDSRKSEVEGSRQSTVDSRKSEVGSRKSEES